MYTEIKGKKNFDFGTKAETLAGLTGRLKHFTIPKLMYFSVADWDKNSEKIIADIKDTFKKKVAIRSSALSEDGQLRSFAGEFESILNVDSNDQNAIRVAVLQVIQSYEERSKSPKNQILIQEMIDEVLVSGVITTKVLEDGAPYYVFNYDDETGRTDSVTSGRVISKTAYLHRSTENQMIDSDRLRVWLEGVRELESVTQSQDLDIEFGYSLDQRPYLFQVRRITVAAKWNKQLSEFIVNSQNQISEFVEMRSRKRGNLLGDRTILGIMPDWNPAEIIGLSPRLLALSLYRYLVTDDSWRLSRHSMGYRNPTDENLMVVLGGRPFIDVRNSFNSFIPETVSDELGNKLVNLWLDKLDQNPHFHGKVEFEIANTIFDFAVEGKVHALPMLSELERKNFLNALRDLTNKNVTLKPNSSLIASVDAVDELDEQHIQEGYVYNPNTKSLVSEISRLLTRCRSGVFAFAVIARHAFIAESLLRSMVSRNALSEERAAQLKRSIHSISTDFANDFNHAIENQTARKTFLAKYGHLRPGTYDILSKRYDQRSDLFVKPVMKQHKVEHESFTLTSEERNALEKLLKEAGLTIGADELVAYVRKAIPERERAKFVFTRDLSNALELAALWGKKLELSRDQISLLDIGDILDLQNAAILESNRDHFKDLVKVRAEKQTFSDSLRLGYLIRGTKDLFVVPVQRGEPNFIGAAKGEFEPVYVSARMESLPDLTGKIVCIENADPGFDWLFTKGIGALLTKYGGPNSHMAIRCVEFGLPAVIGCGEKTFEAVINSAKIELNCSTKELKGIHD